MTVDTGRPVCGRVASTYLGCWQFIPGFLRIRYYAVHRLRFGGTQASMYQQTSSHLDQLGANSFIDKR
ncbi:unnamed protein product [Calypogeia fissa]